MSAQAKPQVLDTNKKADPKHAYILPADQSEAIRLELQHRTLKEAWDGRILFCPFEEQGTYSVLDSGVGRASWICDIATQLSPSSDLQGIDIKDNNFPPELPPNLSLSINSVLSLTDDWTSRFDIVHQRLLMAALRNAEWPIALSHIYRVLRPGGWVQLGEYGKWVGGPCAERIWRMHCEIYKLRDLNHDIAQDLPGLLKEAGFTDIHEEKRITPAGAWAGRLGENVRDMSAAYAKALKTAVLESGGVGFAQTEEEFDRYVDDYIKECDETKGTGMEFYIFYAQRPLN